MMYRILQGKIGNAEYSVHWSQNSNDWQIYWKNDELPEMQFMTWEQLLAQLSFLHHNKQQIADYLNFQNFINRYGYEGRDHKVENPDYMVIGELKKRLLRAIEKRDPRGYIRVSGRSKI